MYFEHLLANQNCDTLYVISMRNISFYLKGVILLLDRVCLQMGHKLGTWVQNIDVLQWEKQRIPGSTFMSGILVKRKKTKVFGIIKLKFWKSVLIYDYIKSIPVFPRLMQNCKPNIFLPKNRIWNYQLSTFFMLHLICSQPVVEWKFSQKCRFLSLFCRP